MSWKHWICVTSLCLVPLSGNAVTPMINAGNASSIFLNSDGSVWGTGSVTSYSPGAPSPVRLLSLPNVVAVATGLADYALLGDGTVWASGSSNNYGQLGDGTAQPHSDPRQVPGLSNVRDIKAGGHVLALKADGTVWAWGNNAQGQLGDGTRIDRYSPMQVPDLSDVMQISASSVASLALKSDGTVWRWGGTIESYLVPSQVPNLDSVAAISAGPENSMALRADGTVWIWGSNDSGQIGNGRFGMQLLPAPIPGLGDVVAVDARGMRYSVALKADGSVWTWGANNLGQLGVGGITYSTTPVQVPGLSDILTISAGFTHALAMRRDGTVFAWGDNSHGQLGDGTLQYRAESRAVLGPGGSGQISLLQAAPANPNQLPSATIEFDPPSGRAPLSVNFIAHANDPDGSVTAYYWQSSDGQQATGPSATFVFSVAGSYTINLLVEDNAGGRGTARTLVVAAQPPGAVTTADPKVAIQAGNGMALTNDGRILTWGYDGGLGRQQPGVFGHMIPVPSANGITGAVDIAMSRGGTKFVVLSDGSVLAWGANDKGQLGAGSQANVTSSPQFLTSLPAVQALAAGGDHVLALTRDGKVFGWGRNAEGQLGLGDNQNRFSPVEISGLSNVVAIAAGFNFSLALTANGMVWAWGDNCCAQLGDGSGISRNLPLEVPGLASVQKLFATGATGIAIDADGAIWASGYLPFSFAGDVAPPSVFRRVPLLDGAVQLAGGGQHILLRKADGTVWVVGMRASMALGVEGTGDIQVPQQVPGIKDAIWVAGIANSSMVLRGDGTVLAWGRNSGGELGDGTLAQRVTPVAVVNETADGFLDLIPGTDFELPPSVGVPFFAVASGIVADIKATVSTTTKFNAPDVGKTGAVFVTATVPPGSLVPAQSAMSGVGNAGVGASAARSASGSKTSAATAAGAFTLIQLTSSGWQPIVNGQLFPYASGVLGDQLSAQSILDNTDTTNLKGAQFCLGYGLSAAQMVASGTMRVVASIPDPDATSTTAPTCIVAGAPLSYSLALPQGWSLLGNSLNQSLTAASLFNDANSVTSVWKWDANTLGWQFYTPLMDVTALQAYAASKGYAVLNIINPGEGYWVNAKAQPTIGTQSGDSFILTGMNLAKGWNLVATGNDITPAEFNASLKASAVPASLKTLWAWDNSQSAWYFYAPSLETQGATALSGYIANKGYLDFSTTNKKLGNGTGFWVNR